VIARRRRLATVAVVSKQPPPAGQATLVLERVPETPHEPDFVADAPLVGFDAFLPDRRVYGWIRLAADRLTDVLNAHAELLLVNAQLERLADGTVQWQEQLRLERDGLLAVRAGGPRGDPARREHLRLHPLVVQSGPYLIGGYVHARHGIGPIEEIESRPPMIPLSTAWLEHWSEGRRHRQWAGTILFNRTLADAIEVVREEDLEFGVTTYPVRPGAGRPRPA
jgi:hypothetical protein